MQKPEKIDVLPLFQELDQMLIELLGGLTPSQWSAQTLAPKWTVKDIASHLLDGNLRSLSMLRDDYYSDQPDSVQSYETLVQFLNEMNASWVQATQRLSPRIIIDLLEVSGREYYDFLQTLHPNEKATFAVAWAGESESQNWFHLAREYTEKWHHQQQIRFTIGDHHTLLEEKWFSPYLNTSVRALPHHYRSVRGEKGDLIKFHFYGAFSKNWYLYYTDHWELYEFANRDCTCEVYIGNEYAWRIFTKGIKPKEALAAAEIKGKRDLGVKIFDMISVMA